MDVLRLVSEDMFIEYTVSKLTLVDDVYFGSKSCIAVTHEQTQEYLVVSTASCETNIYGDSCKEL